MKRLLRQFDGLQLTRRGENVALFLVGVGFGLFLIGADQLGSVLV